MAHDYYEVLGIARDASEADLKRAYRKLAGLYDAVIKAAVLGDREAGLVATLTLSGVSFENVERLTARFLERFAWR